MVSRWSHKPKVIGSNPIPVLSSIVCLSEYRSGNVSSLPDFFISESHVHRPHETQPNHHGKYPMANDPFSLS